MPNHYRTSELSYADVSAAARDVGRAHGVSIRITLDLPIREGTGKAFNVRCAAWRSDKEGEYRDMRGVSAPWPSVDSRTFAGLLYKLVLQLDEALTDDERGAAERQLELFAHVS